ncbi:MAG: hypothetical protein AAF289_08780 [Cyanobacteria bacterium P01_A01_bin.135]
MRIIRLVVAAFACALLIFSSAAPAMAVSASSKSSPTEGEAQLDGVYNKAKDVIKSEPLPDEDEQANVGASDLNVAQQGAKGETNTPANSKGATTVEKSIKETLENVLP